MKQTKHRERNYMLDFIKGIACICVVFMHCEFPGWLGIVIQTVSRFCVPFFFMVSGYYCLDNDLQRLKRKTMHILKITIGAMAFYTVFALIQYLLGEKQVFHFGLLDVIGLIAVNKPPNYAGHLWFLLALLYDYILYWFATRIKKIHWAYKMILVLIIIYILTAQGAFLFGLDLNKLIYRNFLVEGFAFFMLGNWLHANADKVAKISDPILLGGIAGFTALSVVERLLVGRDFGVNICTFPQVFCIFIFAMNHPAFCENQPLRKLGTRCSMFIYILHWFVWRTLEYVYQRIGISENTAALYALPLLVLGLSILLSLLMTVRKKKEA